MAPRLIELRRALKPTGSIYLHCDPTASHYLKLLLDAIFGAENFVNEIIWHYRKWPTGKFSFQHNHDVLLFYSRSQNRERTFNQLFMERAASTLKRFGTAKIVSGHDAEGRRLPSQTEDEDSEGVRQDDVWDIGRVPPIKQLFPTEKPPKLLERIILASSDPGDVVLDPFCGCGTAIVVAQALKRHWIGIDITHLAVALIKHRLRDSFPRTVSYTVLGEPVSLPDAEALAAQDRYAFQWWALSLVHARPVEQKKGADHGVDGRLYFHDDPKAKTKQIILSVKSGKTSVKDTRELRAVLERQEAQIGVLITLESPSKPMISDAAGSGFYTSPMGGRYPRIQIRTIAELFAGNGIEYPSWSANTTFKRGEVVLDVAEALPLPLEAASQTPVEGPRQERRKKRKK